MNKTAVLQIRLTPEQKEAWAKKAQAQKMELSEFIRFVMDRVELKPKT